MSKTLFVVATSGLKVPMEENARKYIEAEAVEVPDNTYYRRLIIAGDLVESTKPKAKKEPKDGQ